MAGPADDYFADVVRAFLASGQARKAPSALVESAPFCRWVVPWLERNLGSGPVRREF